MPLMLHLPDNNCQYVSIYVFAGRWDADGTNGNLMGLLRACVFVALAICNERTGQIIWVR